jgi:hypothetical protein
VSDADHLGERCPGRVDPFGQFLGVETTDWVLHDQQTRLYFSRLGLSQDEWLECFRGDDIGRDAALSEFNAVVETPR